MNKINYIMVFILLPFFIFCYFTRKQQFSFKKRLICAGLFTAACVCSAFAGRIIFSSGTPYEWLFIEYECSIVFMMAFRIFAEKQKFTVRFFLLGICLMAAGTAFYSILTYGQAVLHSDTATAVLLAQSQLKHKSIFPQTWAYANGEVWMLSLELFTMPFTVLMENQSLARQAGSLLLVLTVAVCMYFHDRKVFGCDSWMISIPVFLVFMPGSGDVNLYSAAYAGILMRAAIFTMLMYLLLYQKCSRWTAALFILLNLLGSINGIRHFAEFIVPLWAACMIVLYVRYGFFGVGVLAGKLEKRKFLKQSFWYSAVFLLPAAAGYGMIYKKVVETHIVNSTLRNSLVFADSLEKIWDNLVYVILDMFANFGFTGGMELFTLEGIQNMLSFFVCLLMVFIVPVLQAKKIKEEADSVKFFFLYTVIHNVIFMLLGILFGKALEGRYMLSTEYLSIIVSSRYMMRYWINGKRCDARIFWTASFACAAAVSCAAMLKIGSGWAETVEQKKDYVHTLEEHGLGSYKGYATFWNAYVNEIYSDLRLSFASVGDTDDLQELSAQKWLVDTERYEPEKKGSFLLLDAEQNASISEKLGRIYGTVKESFSVDDMFVYVWDYDICERNFRSQEADGSIDYMEKMNLSGAVLDQPVIWDMQPEQFIFGPYLNLHAGTYKLVIDARTESRIQCSITADAGMKEIKRYTLKNGKNEITFTLDELSCQIEFPVYAPKDSPVTIYQVLLEDENFQTRTDYTGQMRAGGARNIGETCIYIPVHMAIDGPGIELDAGSYLLMADAEMTSPVTCRITAGESKQPVREYELKPGHNEVEFTLEEDTDFVEFPISSTNEEQIKIKRIALKKQEVQDDSF